MNHFDLELKNLKNHTTEMMKLVFNQLLSGKEALFNFNKEIASQILKQEKKVNKFELKIDSECESILALYKPVANDLRFVMAVFKINANLERIGDNAEGIARHVMDFEAPPPKDFIEHIRLEDIYNNSIEMLHDVQLAFNNENTLTARQVFPRDKILDKINRRATERAMPYMKNQTDVETHQLLDLLSIIRKLERIGDLSKNNAEEIIFYLEAKVLKHHKKSKKLLLKDS